MLYHEMPPHLLVPGTEEDAHNVDVATSAGHATSVHAVDDDEEWAALVAYNLEHGPAAIAKFNAVADAADGAEELLDRLDVTIRAPAGRLLGKVDWTGGLIDAREPIAAQVYGTVLPRFATLLGRGARFLLQPGGGLSFRIPSADWGLDDATAFLHGDTTECGRFMVLIAFGND